VSIDVYGVGNLIDGYTEMLHLRPRTSYGSYVFFLDMLFAAVGLSYYDLTIMLSDSPEGDAMNIDRNFNCSL
jgi:hypothetical protein